MKTKNFKKVLRRLKKFYERENRGEYLKVSQSVFKSKELLKNILDAYKLKAKRSWIKGLIRVDIAEDGDDFVKDLITIRFSYSYPKYGNL